MGQPEVYLCGREQRSSVLYRAFPGLRPRPAAGAAGRSKAWGNCVALEEARRAYGSPPLPAVPAELHVPCCVCCACHAVRAAHAELRRDFDPFSLRQRLPSAVALLARQAEQNGGTAYVHCTAGGWVQWCTGKGRGISVGHFCRHCLPGLGMAGES